MILRLVGRLLLLALPLAIGATVVTAAASTVGVPTGSAVDVSSLVTADHLKPVECAGITLTSVIAGSGVFNGVGNTNELIVGSATADTVNGLLGDDCIVLGGGADSANGAAGADIILGQAGNDTLNGGPGNDELFGGAGDDELDGDAGIDVCTGGGDPGDTFIQCETQL